MKQREERGGEGNDSKEREEGMRQRKERQEE